MKALRNFAQSVLDWEEEHADCPNDGVAVFVAITQTISFVSLALFALTVVQWYTTGELTYLGSEHIIDGSQAFAFFIVGSVALPAFFTAIVDVIFKIINHFGSVMYGDEYDKIPSIFFCEQVLSVWYCVSKYGWIIPLVTLSFLWTPLGIVISTWIGAEVLARIYNKVFKLKKALNKHIADKDAHK